MKNRTLNQAATNPSDENPTFTKSALVLAENIDWNIGRVLGLLSDLNLDEETIIFLKEG